MQEVVEFLIKSEELSEMEKTNFGELESYIIILDLLKDLKLTLVKSLSKI